MNVCVKLDPIEITAETINHKKDNNLWFFMLCTLSNQFFLFKLNLIIILSFHYQSIKTFRSNEDMTNDITNMTIDIIIMMIIIIMIIKRFYYNVYYQSKLNIDLKISSNFCLTLPSL